MSIDAKSVCLIVLPLALVDVSIRMPELTFAVCFVEHPLSLILCSIWPLLLSKTVSLPIFQVSLVDSSVFKVELLYEFQSFTLSYLLPVSLQVMTLLEFIRIRLTISWTVFCIWGLALTSLVFLRSRKFLNVSALAYLSVSDDLALVFVFLVTSASLAHL